MEAESIAVISDTHGSLPDRLLDRLKQADEIWHLGDVTQPDIISPIQSLGRPLSVVEGNCDPADIWPRQLELKRHGHLFRLHHLPPRELPDDALAAVLYGHLHRPLQNSHNAVRILNPGAVNGPRDGSVSSFAWIRFSANRSWSWDVETL